MQVFTDMDNCETNFMLIDGLFDEEKLLYGNEEDIAEIYNPVRDGLNSLSGYLETPNDGTISKGHIESILRSFYPMFNFDNEILCGAYAVLDEDLAFSDWHNF